MFLPEPTLSAKKETEKKQEWLVVGRARGKLQVAGSQSPESPKGKDTDSPISMGETSASYASRLHELSKKFNPEYENFNEIKHLERQLKAKKHPRPVEASRSLTLSLEKSSVPPPVTKSLPLSHPT